MTQLIRQIKRNKWSQGIILIFYFFFPYRGYYELRGSLDYITNHLPEQLSSRSGARRIPALTVGLNLPVTI